MHLPDADRGRRSIDSQCTYRCPDRRAPLRLRDSIRAILLRYIQRLCRSVCSCPSRLIMNAIERRDSRRYVAVSPIYHRPCTQGSHLTWKFLHLRGRWNEHTVYRTAPSIVEIQPVAENMSDYVVEIVFLCRCHLCCSALVRTRPFRTGDSGSSIHGSRLHSHY